MRPALAAGAGKTATAGAVLNRPLVRDRALPPLPKKALVRLYGDGSSFGHVSEAQYVDLRNATIAILKKYPANEHYFIGTGRDPAPLIAALENLGGRRLAMNFPASNVVGSTNITPALLGKYFRRLVPDPKIREDILSGRRSLVLLDQTSSGKTPVSLAPYLRKYFASIGSPAEMIKLALSDSTHRMMSGVRTISTKPFPDVARYAWSPYEGVVSEFPRHVLGLSPMSDLVQRPAYVKFRGAVLERMKRDQVLDDFLATQP